MVSLGFSRAADYVWPMLKPVLDEHIVKGTVKYVTISGHSLGAAVSSLLAYRMQVTSRHTYFIAVCVVFSIYGITT
jgi:hypothetical protein